MNFLLVFLGGGIGSVLRYVIGIGLKPIVINLPLATFVSNVISCLVFLGVYLWFQSASVIPLSIRNFLLVGFCGGLSTFSTFSFETFELLKKGDWQFAILNILFSMFICIGLFFLLPKLKP